MSRSIYCLKCFSFIKDLHEEHSERARVMTGDARAHYHCDFCNEDILVGNEAGAVTFHPSGHEIVKLWEHDYLEVTTTEYIGDKR